MAEEAGSTNINGVIRITSDDFKFTAKISLFAQRVEIAVFENNTKSGPVVKTLLNPTTAYQLKMIMLKIINDPEAKPIELGIWPFDKDQKIEIYRSSINVGRDESKCIFFELAGEKHKDPIRIYLVTDKSGRINGMTLPKQMQTETGANVIIDVIDALGKVALLPTVRMQSGGGSYQPGPSPDPVSDAMPF